MARFREHLSDGQAGRFLSISDQVLEVAGQQVPLGPIAVYVRSARLLADEQTLEALAAGRGAGREITIAPQDDEPWLAYGTDDPDAVDATRNPE